MNKLNLYMESLKDLNLGYLLTQEMEITLTVVCLDI